ncbi:MAG TPA: hypothetical protein VKU84_07705 [Stellaceae bacterium]|nr:hypothetical protein [Stellaceae bacterium]
MPDKDNGRPIASAARWKQERGDDTRGESEIQATLDDLRFRRAVERVHGLGVRAFYELLIELGGAHSIGNDIARRVERYSRLDREIVRAIGADRFPSRLLRVVRR